MKEKNIRESLQLCQEDSLYLAPSELLSLVFVRDGYYQRIATAAASRRAMKKAACV